METNPQNLISKLQANGLVPTLSLVKADVECISTTSTTATYQFLAEYILKVLKLKSSPETDR